MKAFGIFEGGGAKGLAHIGALKAAEERGIEFMGVAGASAGAIAAALVAAGFTADALYSPAAQSGPAGVFDKNFLDFFRNRRAGGVEWRDVVALRQDAEKTFKRSGALGAWFSMPLFYRRNKEALQKLASDKGFFSSDIFVEWLNGVLAEQLIKTGTPPTGDGGAVLFRDILLPLKIIATDLEEESIRVFNRAEDPILGVAEAVAASISIPFFFKPRKIGGKKYIDGGVVSNFPAWVFDRERRGAGPLVPTFGFKLVSLMDRRTGLGRKTGLPGFARDVFLTAISGDEQLEVRQIENLHIIPIKVQAGTFDFDMTRREQNGVYGAGQAGAREFFDKQIGPKDPGAGAAVLRMLHGYMLSSLNKGPALHLRVNVVMRTTLERFRVYYTYNMDLDPDDLLEFDESAGACGSCWTKRDFVICDLADARQNFAQWKMSKYQQALVRPSLKALLCVPVFDGASVAAKLQGAAPIGILNFDSDADLLQDFARHDIQQRAAECARIVADWLRK